MRTANLYFLAVVMMQTIPGLSPTPWQATALPLVFVLTINAIKVTILHPRVCLHAFCMSQLHCTQEVTEHPTEEKESVDQQNQLLAVLMSSLQPIA